MYSCWATDGIKMNMISAEAMPLRFLFTPTSLSSPPDEGGGEAFQVGDRQMLSFVVLFI